MIDKYEINRSLAINLLRTREAVMDRFRPMLASVNLTEQQWRVLRGLSEHGATEAGKLASIACILPQSLSRIAKNFEKKNLIKMETDPKDAVAEAEGRAAESIHLERAHGDERLQVGARYGEGGARDDRSRLEARAAPWARRLHCRRGRRR